MLPVNTRPIIRSRSPPPRRPADTPNSSTPQLPGPDAGSVQEVPEPASGVLSIRAAVREYEMINEEITGLNTRLRELRARLAHIKASVESFMQHRNLERLGTRDGRLTVKMCTRSTCTRPGKKETVRCVEETLGPDNADVAEELLHKLFDERKQVRTVTSFNRRSN